MSQTIEKNIQQPKKIESEKTKEKVKKFEDKIKEFGGSIRKEPLYLYTTGVQASLLNIEEVIKKWGDYQK